MRSILKLAYMLDLEQQSSQYSFKVLLWYEVSYKYDPIRTEEFILFQLKERQLIAENCQNLVFET